MGAEQDFEEEANLKTVLFDLLESVDRLDKIAESLNESFDLLKKAYDILRAMDEALEGFKKIEKIAKGMDETVEGMKRIINKIG